MTLKLLPKYQSHQQSIDMQATIITISNGGICGQSSFLIITAISSTCGYTRNSNRR